MPESIFVDKSDKTKPSHHDNPLRSFRCASYALKWMDEVNDHYLGQPVTYIVRHDGPRQVIGFLSNQRD